MYYLVWWMTLLLIGNCQISQTKEILDFLVLYRTPYETTWPPSSYVKKIKEYHRWGNTNGMLLKIGDDYADSNEGMVPLNCAPATASCQWKMSGSWALVDVNISAEQNFTIDAANEVEEEKYSCDKVSGGYKLICHDKNKRPKYSCPSKLEQFHNLCFPINDYRLIRTSVSLDYMGQTVKLIVLPLMNATTVITVSTKYHYGQQSNVQVIEMDEYKNRRSLLHVNEAQSRAFQLQSNRVLEVHRSGSGSSLIDISFRRKHLALAGDFGSLSYDIFPVYDSICVSVIYTTSDKNGGIKFNIQLANGTKYEVQEYTERRFGEWKSRTFKSSFGKLASEKVSIQLDVFGKGMTLHSIFGCSPYGSRDIRKEIAVSIPKVRRHLNNFKDTSGKCVNGGVYNGEAKVCICPEGFSGESCDEGCGPLYFGSNCSIECSNFATGCIGMIFCKKYLSCLCASGFTGDFCEKECDPGFYGPSCRQKCGDCSAESCDRFTGYCHDGCKSGLRRPFCHIFYKYSKMTPMITYQDINTVTFEINTEETEGMGEPEYYQIQYRKNVGLQEILWTELQPQKIKDISVTTNISDFLRGVDYKLRVVYIDKDGNSYQGERVPTTYFTTLCTVPTSAKYELKATSSSSTIQLYWKYSTNKTDCPITGYTIFLERKWNKVQHKVSGEDQYFVFDTLLPGVTYEVKIKAHTQLGEAPTSPSISVKTEDDVPLHVSYLRVTEKYSRKLRLAWKPPKFTGGSLQEFVVKYQCTGFLACEELCGSSSGEISVPANQSYVDLQELLPHSRYFIEVAASSSIPGPYTSIEAVTQDSAPDAAPEMSETPVVSSTNVTLSVQWRPLKKCNFLNGYFAGYGYALFSANNTVVGTGNTTNTNITFEDLTPQATYFVHVHTISSGGWNEEKQLIINASTAATVPDKVKNLSIYKRGRRVIGVRWAQPLNSYGEIESFSVSHCQLNDCETAITERVLPAPCVPWPSLYCHSISNLSPNKQYSVSVRARNVLVNEYGEAVTVNTVTSEGVPAAPSSLLISARTSDSVTLEWGPPDTFNGILRSFLINVEHLDSANSSNCCVYAPLQEVPVKSEDSKYKFEVTDLIPASKYIIAVSAKTISIGPSAFITLSTPPQIPELIQPPTLEENNRVKVPLGKGFPGVNGTYLLLVLLPNGNSTSVIWNSEIEEKLHSLVTTKSFYIVEEYNAEDLKSSLEEEETNSLDVQIGKGVGPRNGTIGELEDPFLPSDFSVGLALVLDYNGALNVGFASAEAAIETNMKPEDNLSK